MHTTTASPIIAVPEFTNALRPRLISANEHGKVLAKAGVPDADKAAWINKIQPTLAGLEKCGWAIAQEADSPAADDPAGEDYLPIVETTAILALGTLDKVRRVLPEVQNACYRESWPEGCRDILAALRDDLVIAEALLYRIASTREINEQLES